MSLKIQNLIDEELRSNNKKREIRSWHPSSLGSCLTGTYLARLGVEPDEEIDDRTLRVFDIGKKLEDWIVGLIEKKVDKAEKQVKIALPEYDLSGYADLLVETPNGKMLYEIKSKHSKSFWYMDKKKEGAQKQHKMQLWTYLKALNLPEGRIVYISKDDMCILEYPVLLNDKEIETETIKELEILNRAWKEKLPPLPITDEKDWRVKYCRFHKNGCLKQEKYLKEIK